ncbi:MAG: SDR family oxidoreductase [Parasphingopyxis sp.]|uniref:SDR family NAD(P)-dependent oxidoreductase n=1 Tax=Parasphingopyxis sp. TaxID=1920299 RepID=UPI0032EE4891
MGEFSGKTAVVTGASRGIGAETAKRIAAEGARVAVHYGNSPDAARDVVAAIESAGGSAFAVQADLADSAAIVPMVDAIREGFGSRPVDFLVNNAGVGSEWGKHGFGNVTAEHFDALFHVNVLAPLLITQALAENFAEGGRVVLLSSVSGRSAQPRSPVYSASKAAVNSLTPMLALALAKRGVSVNAIAPGAVDTEFLTGIRTVPGFEEAAKKACWSGRLGTVEDIAGAIMMLLRKESGWINGRVIEATGGLA